MATISECIIKNHEPLDGLGGDGLSRLSLTNDTETFNSSSAAEENGLHSGYLNIYFS